jgi:hypothetical protein
MGRPSVPEGLGTLSGEKSSLLEFKGQSTHGNIRKDGQARAFLPLVRLILFDHPLDRSSPIRDTVLSWTVLCY